MRVAVVAPLVAPLLERQAHGNHTVLMDVARGLRDRGHDVAVFCAAGSSVPGVRVVTIEVEPAVREAFIVPAEMRRDGSDRDGGGRDEVERAMDRAFSWLFDEIRRFEPDAVSQHAFDVPAIVQAETLPSLHTVHLPPIVRPVVETLAASRRPIAVVSDDQRQRWAEAGVGVDVIRNGVPDFLGDDCLPEPRLRAGDRVGATAVVAGRISAEKGTATAILAALRGGFRPIVVGSIYDRPYFERAVAPLLAETGTPWRPPVSRIELAQLLARAAVALMPVGWDEPFGLVAAEAQMVGCPVVGYRRGALPEVVEEGVSGLLVEPGDETALVGALRRVGGLSRRATRESARRRLGVERMVDGYEDALVRVAGGAPSNRPPDVTPAMAAE